MEENHLGGISRYSTKYDFRDRVIGIHESHTTSNKSKKEELYKAFTYDSRGCLISESVSDKAPFEGKKVVVFSKEPVIISEIMYSVPLNKHSQLSRGTGGYIELYNPTDEYACIMDYVLKNSATNEEYQFDGSVNIPPKGYLMLVYRHPDDDLFELQDMYPTFELTPEREIIYQDALKLGYELTTITLYSYPDIIQDMVTYEGGTYGRFASKQLVADNTDETDILSCIALHRIKAEINEKENSYFNKEHWTTAPISPGRVSGLGNIDFFYYNFGNTLATVKYDYDELDRLKSITYGDTPYALTDSMKYNTQGWKISQKNKYFDMKLRYYDPKLGTTPSYTGNITEWEWKP